VLEILARRYWHRHRKDVILVSAYIYLSTGGYLYSQHELRELQRAILDVSFDSRQSLNCVDSLSGCVWTEAGSAHSMRLWRSVLALVSGAICRLYTTYETDSGQQLMGPL
jgi:hypothetical protein